jgi:hypothetical protein
LLGDSTMFKPAWLFAFLLLLTLVPVVIGHSVVLKNGKIKQGTLVSEDNDVIVLEDAAGLRMTFKKTNVDLVKTAAANVTAPAANPPAKSLQISTSSAKGFDATPPKSTQTKPAPATKKPSRTLTEKDLERLRKKYEFGSSSSGADSGSEFDVEQNGEDESKGRNEQDWKSDAQKLSARVQQAEGTYSRLKNDCELLRGATVQTHTLTDKKGNNLNMAETAQTVCDQADQAKQLLDTASEDYQNFLSDAKHENVPPGWIRNQDGSDPQQQ